MNKKLIEHLIQDGWEICSEFSLTYISLRKGNASLFEDTSSWLILGHNKAENGRIFDIHNPSDYEAGWTANLINKLVNDFEILNRNSKIDQIVQ